MESVFSEEELQKFDYQLKTKELVKEALFLRQYGVKNNQRRRQNEEIFDQERSL